jgi:3-oxoadipate CoA-transferase beta subunit
MPESLPARSWKPLTRQEIAVRTAADIPEGWYVNLGIGIPTMIADYIPANREVVLHSENGLVGMGPAPPPDRINRWLVNAGKQNVTMVVGGSFVDQAASFGIIRGGHLDLCVLGAFEVAENGDLANWATSLNDTAPGVGGAMDLAVGARRLWVVMEHTTKAGEPRLKRQCTYPLTARGVVSRIYTNLAVLDVTPAGLRVVETVPGITLPELQTMTDAPLLSM